MQCKAHGRETGFRLKRIFDVASLQGQRDILRSVLSDQLCPEAAGHDLAAQMFIPRARGVDRYLGVCSGHVRLLHAVAPLALGGGGHLHHHLTHTCSESEAVRTRRETGARCGEIQQSDKSDQIQQLTRGGEGGERRLKGENSVLSQEESACGGNTTCQKTGLCGQSPGETVEGGGREAH